MYVFLGVPVMMQQVAKGLLEEARGKTTRPSVPRGSLADSPLSACQTLLHFRCVAGGDVMQSCR